MVFTLTPTLPYETNCVSLVETLPSIDDLEGRIVIQDEDSGDDYIYDLAADSRVMLKALWDTLIVSPDHSMIAFLDDSSQRLFVSSIDGTVISSYLTDPLHSAQYLFPVQWLDNQHILMFASGTGEDPNNLAPYAAIFDLDSGRSEKIALDFTDINLDYHEQGSKWYFVMWSSDFRIAVSPDQDYLVYPGEEDSDDFLVIWDRDNDEEVSRFPNIMPWNTVPRWSPDGERFAITASGGKSSEEIFLLDRYGNYDQITAFGDDSPGNIHFQSWSPDGKKVAFWLDLFDAEERIFLGGRLFVINLEDGSTTNYCIEGTKEIYWSLDGDYLFIERIHQGQRSEFSVTIVDMKDLWAFDLIDYASVYGVMKEE
jgi:WD40 repeat protein